MQLLDPRSMLAALAEGVVVLALAIAIGGVVRRWFDGVTYKVPAKFRFQAHGLSVLTYRSNDPD